ncbi:MAG: DUF4153 domain-containing protein [Anaerolineae bacterium]
MAKTSSPVRILLIALALGGLFDLLFNGPALGVSWPLFVVLVVGALFVLGWVEGLRPAWRNLWLLPPLLFLAAMVAVRANAFLTFLNVTLSLGLLALFGYYYAGGELARLGLLGYPLVALRVAGSALYRAAPLLRDGLRALPRRRRSPWPLLRGVLLALPVVVVFTCLLTAADLVFNRLVRRVLEMDFWREVTNHGLLILAASWILAGALAYALTRRPGQETALDRLWASVGRALGAELPREAGEESFDCLLRGLGHAVNLGMVEAATVLLAVNMLFGAFVGIQFAYLFGGEANITAQGYTYAEYARRGFFELLAVAALSLGLVLGLRWLTRRETLAKRRLFGGLASLLVGLVLVMLGSAFYRMRLYELAYGFTELRLYAYVSMVWLAALFVWLLVVLWRLPRCFAIGTLAAGLGFAVTLNIMSPDAFIVRQNLARYAATGEMDGAYLATLSDDAVPLLVQAAPFLDEKDGRPILNRLSVGRAAVEEAWPWAHRRNWPALHWGRWQAAESLLQWRP